MLVVHPALMMAIPCTSILHLGSHPSPMIFAYMRGRNRRPEGGECEPMKISSKIQTVGLYPKITTSPQEFQVKFGIAMEELNQHKTPLECARENMEANEKICRPGRLGPVRPVSPTGRAGVQKPRPVRPVSETGQTGYTQTDRKQSFKHKSRAKKVQIQRNLEDSFASTP